MHVHVHAHTYTYTHTHTWEERQEEKENYFTEQYVIKVKVMTEVEKSPFYNFQINHQFQARITNKC